MSDRSLNGDDLNRQPTEEDFIRLQATTLLYYLHESNPANGLIRDKTDPAAPASIAAVGLALGSIPVLTERAVIAREFAPELVLRPLRFFRDSPHGPEPDATGYRGFYSGRISGGRQVDGSLTPPRPDALLQPVRRPPPPS